MWHSINHKEILHGFLGSKLRKWVSWSGLCMSLAWTSRFSRNPGRESWSEFCLEFLVRKWFSSGNMVPLTFGSKFQVFYMTKWPRTHLNPEPHQKSSPDSFLVRPTKVLDLFPRSSSDFSWVRPTSVRRCRSTVFEGICWCLPGCTRPPT